MYIRYFRSVQLLNWSWQICVSARSVDSVGIPHPYVTSFGHSIGPFILRVLNSFIWYHFQLVSTLFCTEKVRQHLIQNLLFFDSLLLLVHVAFHIFQEDNETKVPFSSYNCQDHFTKNYWNSVLKLLDLYLLHRGLEAR